MFLLLLIRLLAAKTVREPHTRFLERFSLIPPHVGANGKEDFFDFLNEYSNKTRSRKDGTQLGYKAPESHAAIISKNKFALKDFEVTFDFILSLEGRAGKGAGFGFWIATDIKNEPRFYGRNQGFVGFGVVVDIEGTPFVKFVDSSGAKRSVISFKYVPEDMYKVSLVRQGGILTAKFIQNGKEHLLYTGNLHLPRDAHLGITSYSGSSASTMFLERIITTALSPTKRVKAKGERGGRSVYIIILGAGAILGLVYYLFRKKPKEFIFKK